jgi:hypothetical protein
MHILDRASAGKLVYEFVGVIEGDELGVDAVEDKEDVEGVRRIWGGCCADCDCDRVRRLLSSL